MKTKNIFYALLIIGVVGFSGCASMKEGKEKSAEAPEAGETKLRLNETPAAVRATIEKELKGADLEDIAMKKRQGKTIYETDIIKNGHKWEVIVGENGEIISKAQEGTAAEKAAETDPKTAENAYRDEFDVSKSNLQSTGDNSYFPIHPGKNLTLMNGKDHLFISILPETKTVDGVTAAVLEEKEEKDGQVIEISRNYFATDSKTGDVYYFGEDVDNFKDGKLISHDSAWLAGEKGARFGLMIPGKAKPGDKYYQEIAPKVALDRVEIVSVNETVKVPAGTFKHCLHLRETTPLEPDVSHKYYAPGIGMIKDDDFELTEKP